MRPPLSNRDAIRIDTLKQNEVVAMDELGLVHVTKDGFDL